MTPPASAQLYGRVLDLNGDPSATCPGLPGVRICVFGTTNCTTSDDDGGYALSGLPGLYMDEVEVSFEKQGYVGAHRAFDRPSDGHFPIRMFGPPLIPMERWSSVLAEMRVAPKPESGAIIVGWTGWAYSQYPDFELAGVQVVLLTANADGPFYTPSANGAPELDLRATGQLGSAWFFNVPPGNHTLKITYDRGYAYPEPGAGLPSNDPRCCSDLLRTIVRPGLVTGVLFSTSSATG